MHWWTTHASLHADATAQNASNLMWALSTMRHRPSETFAYSMQNILLAQMSAAPQTIHPQNVGDMIQALAVLRLQLVDNFLSACDSWVSANIKMLLPNHILAYLNVRRPQRQGMLQGMCTAH